MSPALNRSFALQRFERSNVVEIRNGIMFDFYPGLAHMYSTQLLVAGVSIVRANQIAEVFEFCSI